MQRYKGRKPTEQSKQNTNNILFKLNVARRKKQKSKEQLKQKKTNNKMKDLVQLHQKLH